MWSIGSLPTTTDEKSIDERILPWVRAAGDPYYTWFFQDQTTCQKFLRMWIRNLSSEISVTRIQALVVDDQVIGGIIALDGEHLSKCRTADARQLIAKGSTDERRRLIQRLSLSQGLFPTIEKNEYYLSKVGLTDGYRGKGYGSLLVDTYMEQGRKNGFDRYRLDVCAKNEIAIRCYEKRGFKMGSKSTTKDGELEYCSMRYRE